MTLHLVELVNRLTRAQDMCVAALEALAAGDTDDAQRLMHQASALCAMAAWSAEKVEREERAA